jgi:hypothetical protein
MTISCLLRRERSTGAAHRRSALAPAQVVERDVMAVAGRPLGSLCELEDLGSKHLKDIARACRSRRRDRGRFEALDDEVRAELRNLRSEVARMHAIEAVVDAGRDEGVWLN